MASPSRQLNQDTRQRQVITGLGCICGAGLNTADVWRNTRDGRSAAEFMEVSEVQPELKIPVCRIQHIPIPTEWKRLANKTDRSVQIALCALREALDSAALGHTDTRRIPIIAGTSRGPAGKISEAACPAAAGARPRPSHSATCSIGSLTGTLAAAIGSSSITLTLSNTCASGAATISMGSHFLSAGVSDIVIAGGADAPLIPSVIGPFAAAGLTATGVDPKRACRPFDLKRNGMLLGEGAAFVILETAESAAARGVTPLAELTGAAFVTNPTDRVKPDLTGCTLADTIYEALKNATLQPADLNYINTHGTGTRFNDISESNAIRNVFGNRCNTIPCSSTKPVTGHCLGATSAIEAVISVMALREKCIPPTINFQTPDPECALDCTPNHHKLAELRNILSVSQGFWGNSAALVLSRP
ncbi:MAG: beta-ketoacyl-[acyl-carrier-protein] synthase family protein [Verrucomicrobia bacterium]|nr:beta-ketoacyl-[acyl-carrier-protein] synthase family protein [Verrucomicrobiota bacterium]